VFFQHELLARNLFHCGQHTLVLDAVFPQMPDQTVLCVAFVDGDSPSG
jgi:hypothetical protein